VPGFFGKVPSHGDFITRGLTRAFTDPWDAWLQSCIAESKGQLGERWLDVYLTSPIWRFGLGPGLCGPSAWAGILMPSVDRVGRYFPLTVVTEVPQDVQPLRLPGAAGAWFEALESIALRSLDDDRFEANALQEAIGAVGEPAVGAARVDAPPLGAGKWSLVVRGAAAHESAAAVAHALVQRHAPRYSVWWTAGAEDPASAVAVAADLPEPARFIDLLHGGSRPAGDPRAGSAPVTEAASPAVAT
jgi:type VI secretion system protein ImpM